MGWMSAIYDAHKKKVDVELLYNTVQGKFNQLEIRCGRENQHPAEGALRTAVEQLGIRRVGDKMLDWGTCPREAGPPGPRLSSPEERKKKTQLLPIESGSICCSSVRSPTPFHTQPFQIKWEVYFSKELCRLALLCRYDSCRCICIMWLYNTFTSSYFHVFSSEMLLISRLKRS